LFQESDRVNIRHLLGYASTFLQADPRLENALTNVQSIADGGTRPDSSTEIAVKGFVADALSIESQMKAIWPKAIALQVDGPMGVKVDPWRGIAMLRSEGRRIVGHIAHMISTTPRNDVFSTPEYNPEGSPFPEVDSNKLPW
jgi:hypothetical protein